MRHLNIAFVLFSHVYNHRVQIFRLCFSILPVLYLTRLSSPVSQGEGDRVKSSVRLRKKEIVESEAMRNTKSLIKTIYVVTKQIYLQ